MNDDIGSAKLDIQYVTDRYGNRVFVQIPVEQWELIRTRLPEMEKNETPPIETPEAEVMERQGILVVRSKASGDIADIVKQERERYLAERIGKIWE